MRRTNCKAYALLYSYDDDYGCRNEVVAISESVAPLSEMLREQVDTFMKDNPNEKWHPDLTTVPDPNDPEPTVASFGYYKGMISDTYSWVIEEADLVREQDVSDERRRELRYIDSFVFENSFYEEIARDQLRILWTAYCLHHGLDADTKGYDDDLSRIWEAICDAECDTADWSDYESFQQFMCRYLV